MIEQTVSEIMILALKNLRPHSMIMYKIQVVLVAIDLVQPLLLALMMHSAKVIFHQLKKIHLSLAIRQLQMIHLVIKKVQTQLHQMYEK